MHMEASKASRNWLGTLTVAPSWRFAALSACRKHAAQNGFDFDRLEADEQFALQHEFYCRHITLWLKRVRKNSSAPLRYVSVTESHKSGDPHYHLLIHEQSPDQPVRKKVLQEAWSLGFSSFKLIDDLTAVGYVTKYLAKDARARVRASILYGKTSQVGVV